MRTGRLQMGVWLVATAAFLLFAAPVQAQLGAGAQSADERVRKLVEAVGWKYQVDSDGDYKLIFRYEDERTQLVYASSKTLTVGSLEVREIWAPAFKTEGVPSGELLLDLLRDNNKVKIGAWRLLQSGGNYIGVFAAQVSADCDRDTFQTVVRAVGITADEKEKAVTEKDDF